MLILAALIERIPVFGLSSIDHIYYNASAWGTTTIATMMILLVALRLPTHKPKVQPFSQDPRVREGSSKQ